VSNFGTWLKRLVAIFLGIGLAILVLEAVLRLAYPIFPYTIQAALRDVHLTPFTERRILPKQIWQSDGAYQLVSRANAVDEMQFPDTRVGFRVTTKNFLDPKSHVGFRVASYDWEPRWPVDAVVVGDSFSFCYTEYESCWVRRLESERGMSVVNLGQVATGSISRLNLLNTFGLPYEPAVVIWQWYGNDFNDDFGMFQMTSGMEIEADPVARPARRLVGGQLGHWLETNSAVYWIAQTFASSREELYKYERFVDPYSVDDDGFTFTFGRPYILKAFDLDNENNQHGKALTQEILLKAKQDLDALGIHLVVVLIPSKEEVYERWTTAFLGVDRMRSLGEGRELMVDFCAEHALACLDTTGALRSSAERGMHVYWPDDTHLNVLGNALVADAVWHFLVDEELMVEPGA
jgi:hypothetical protein